MNPNVELRTQKHNASIQFLTHIKFKRPSVGIYELNKCKFLVHSMTRIAFKQNFTASCSLKQLKKLSVFMTCIESKRHSTGECKLKPRKASYDFKTSFAFKQHSTRKCELKNFEAFFEFTTPHNESSSREARFEGTDQPGTLRGVCYCALLRYCLRPCVCTSVQAYVHAFMFLFLFLCVCARPYTHVRTFHQSCYTGQSSCSLEILVSIIHVRNLTFAL